MSNKVSHNEEGNMSLVGHLREVRNRIALVFVALIVVFFACFACIKPLANKLLEMGKNCGFRVGQAPHSLAGHGSGAGYLRRLFCDFPGQRGAPV